MKKQLQQGLDSLQLDISEEKQYQLLEYLALLAKWNRVYNLTAVRDVDQMLSHHLLDSLAIVQPLRKYIAQYNLKNLLDVGSGAGLPGVVLSICNPSLQVTCVDAVGKKAAFIQQTAAALRVPNLRALHSRVEDIPYSYDVVCSRAFSSLSDFVSCSNNTLKQDGIWLAMKGKKPDEEIRQLPSWIELLDIEFLSVPGLGDAQRCIVWMQRTND